MPNVTWTYSPPSHFCFTWYVGCRSHGSFVLGGDGDGATSHSLPGMQYADGGSCAPRPITWNERVSWRCALSETTSLSLSSLSFGPSAMSAW